MRAKPHYMLTALSREKMSPEEVVLIGHIDRFVRAIRCGELTNCLGEDRFSVIEKHVQAAYDYYSQFSLEDMALLKLIDDLSEDLAAEARKEECDEEDLF